MIEFVSANPTGPLHIGHGRGAALGIRWRGFSGRAGKVQTEYYVNDRGFQMECWPTPCGRGLRNCAAKASEFPRTGIREYIRDIAQEMIDGKRDDFSVYPRTVIQDGIKQRFGTFRCGFDSWYSETRAVSGQSERGAKNFGIAELSCRKRTGALVCKSGEKMKSRTKTAYAKSDGSYTYFASDIAYHQGQV